MFSNLTWFVAVLICWSFVDWKVDAQLAPGKANVCAATIKQLYYVSVRKSRIGYQNYRTCCRRIFGICSSRCTRSRQITVYYTTAEVRYKQGYRYFCCSGWARRGDGCPTPICNPGCVNGHCSRPGVCTCKSGYNGNRCEKDIDECLRKPCDQTCKNLPGTYACSCGAGYKKINNDPKSRQCVNVNECLTTPCKCAQPKNCKATCTDTTGSFKCSCNKGFKLGTDQRTCEDINECSSKALNGCQHKCLNNMGSFTCACNKGYKLLPDGNSCQDINECSTLNGGCSQICTNKPGSFQCSCRRGFRLSSDGKTCKDINECSEQKPCDNNNGICKNIFGSYQCSCKVGYQLLPDKKTCRDINECSKKELNGCQHKCSNTVGSFVCSCNVGYRLNVDKKKCDDINECIEQTDKCGHNCHNTIGSYTCSCRPGYRLNGDKILCKALPCVTISSLNHGNISCTGYVTDQSCSYECHSGFNLLGSDQRTCLPSSQWSGNAPQCQRKDCPTIEAPEHGSIMIPCVAKYGFTCLKKCSKGFYLDGTTSAKCVMEGNQTSWTAKDSICRASTPCEPNPCLNNGQCLETSIDTFVCDCSGTLSKGKLCDIGSVDIPTLPQLVLNQWSTDIEIMARPTAIVNIVPKSRMELTFDPPEIRIEVPETSAKFQILSSKTGVFEVEFEIQGRNDFEFETPKSKQVYVFPKKTSLLVDMDISTVIDNAKLIQRNLTDSLVLKSMCPNGKNVGFTTIQSKSVVLPVSMVGVEKVTLTTLKERGMLNPVDEIESFLKTKEIPVFDYQCVNATSELAQQVEYAIKYNFFQAAYLKQFTASMPTWFEFSKTFSEPEYNSANLASQLVTLEDIFSLKCYATGSQGKNRLSNGIHSLYQPYTPVLLKILDKKFEMSKTNRICYFANLEENSFHINSDSSVNFISSPSPDHIFEKLQSSYISVSPTKKEVFVDFSMKMKSFDGRFKGKGFMTLEDSDKFFTRMFNSQNKISGNIALDFDVNLKFLGKRLAVEGKSTQAEYNLTSSGKRDATLKLTTSVNQMKFQSPNAAIRFSPRAKSKLSIEIPMLATGGQIRSISNENALKTYSRYLTRAERNSQGVGNLLATLDQKLADIWSSKTTEYFKHLGNFNTFVMMGIDSTNYYEAINTLQPVKESYINFKSFANVLVENFKNENGNQRLVLALRNVLRALSRTDQLEILPQLEPIKFIDVNGLQMKYSGGLCLYQLCFPSLGSIEIDSPFNKNHVTIKSNLTTFNASRRLHFTDKDSLQINIDKHIGTFTATLTGNLKVFDKVFPIQFSFDQDKFAYSSTISVEGFPSTGFTVSKTKQISNVQWEDMIDSIEGETLETKLLKDRASIAFQKISETTKTRLDLIKQRKSESQQKYQSQMDEVKRARERSEKATLEFNKKNSDYKAKLLDYQKAQNRYSSLLKQNASLLLIERDVSTICSLTKCQDKCIPMMKCDICQKPVKIPTKQWDCNTKIETVRTSQLVETDVTCQETKYFFIPIYTGDCEEDPRTRGYRKQQEAEYLSTVARGSSVGAMIGSVIPGIGSVLGGIIGGIIGAIGGLFSSCDESYEVITKKTVNRWPCKNWTMQVVTTKVPRTKCDLQEILVNGGFSDPEQCNCRQEECSVKATDYSCIKKNKDCQKERKERLEKLGKGSRLHIYFKQLSSNIDRLEDETDLHFSEAERTRKDKDFAMNALNRTINGLRVAEQESKQANKSQDNQQDILRKEICLYDKYNVNNQQLPLVIEKLSLNNKLPIIDNIQIIAKVKELSSGKTQDVPFVFQLDDPESSIVAASRKILYSVLCESSRKRRSLDGDVLDEDQILAFTSWDARQNSTIAEKSCMTFRTTTDFIKDAFKELDNLLQQGNGVQDLTSTISTSLSRLRKDLNASKDADLIYDSQSKLLSSMHSEINGYQNRSDIPKLLETWKEKVEIYTAENNFTVCFGFHDCLETALESLENLPLVSIQHLQTYKNTMVKLRAVSNEIINTNAGESSFGDLFNKTSTFDTLLSSLVDTSLHCSKKPEVKANGETEFHAHSGNSVELECGEVNSALPVKYNWKLHGQFIDGAYESNLKFEATLAKAGVYTCVVTSSVGQTESDGILVHVFESPKILSEPDDIKVFQLNNKENATFICDVSGYPLPNITWYYQTFHHNDQAKLPNDEPELVLENLTKADSGYYFCKATNEYGSITSRKAKLDILKTELPRQYIRLGIDILDIEKSANSTSNETSDGVLNELPELLRSSHLQDITFFLLKKSNKITAKFIIESLTPENITSSMKDLLKLSTTSRQSLANSAANLVNLVFTNESRIYLENDIVLTVDNTSMSYQAILNECNPGYQLHSNGILCVECSSGSFSTNGRKCKPCHKNHYMPNTGSRRCTRCENKLITSQVGSTSSYQCFEKIEPAWKRLTEEELITIIAGCSLFLIILVVTITVLCCKRKQKSTGKHKVSQKVQRHLKDEQDEHQYVNARFALEMECKERPKELTDPAESPRMDDRDSGVNYHINDLYTMS